MRNSIILVGIAVSLMIGPATAEQTRTSKEETIGIGAGATIGALMGGPVGFIIGAAIGAKTGDEFDQRNDKVDTLNTSLAGSRQRIASLELSIDGMSGEIDAMGVELQRLQAVARPELLDLMQVGIEMDLLFRTDEHVLADTTGTRLQNLAASLASMPDVYVRLDGFTDARGDAQYNQELSGRRVAHVFELLVANGVDPSRIRSAAHGESPAIDTDLDSYALERKVSLTLYIEGVPAFAANPID